MAACASDLMHFARLAGTMSHHMKYNSTRLSLSAVILGIILSSTSAFSDPTQRTLSPIELYSRCRAHLTQTPVPLSNPPAPTSISQAVGLCMQLLTQITKTQDPTTGAVKNPSSDTIAVLRTMDEFHRTTFFPNDDLLAATTVATTRQIKDETEPALFYDLALFFDPIFSDILTSPYNGIEALRGPNLTPAAVIPNFYTTQKVLIPSPFSVTNGGGVQVGDLLGVQFIDSVNLKYNMSATTSANQTFYLHQFPNTFPSVGGGILGNLTYLELTLGRAVTDKMDGGILQPRRWSKAVFHDLLCRDLPTLRVGDPSTLQLVEPASVIGPLTPPFRQESSCMQCHGAMDPMASTVRSYSYYNTLYKSTNGTGQGGYGNYLFSDPVSKAKESGLYTDNDGFPYVDKDISFYQRPPNGMLRYRSYDGTLIDVPVLGAAGLGSAIANTNNSSGNNDFYVCAASRYFRYFTGINANLADIQDPANQITLSTAETYYRKLVVSLGALLQKANADFKSGAINCALSPPKDSANFSCANGNTALQQLIYAVFSSSIYQKKSMRDAGVP